MLEIRSYMMEALYRIVFVTCLLVAHVPAWCQYEPATEAEANDRSRVDEEPIPLNLPEVKAAIGYPRIAVATQTEGKVIVKILIDEEGNHVKHLVIANPTAMLTQPVENKITTLRFRPASFNGRRIRCWVTIPFDFHLVPAAGTVAPVVQIFHSLDSAMVHPDAVTHLYLRNRDLKHIPSEVWQFPNLRVLDLSGNHITSIPDEVAFLHSLQYLGLSHNALSDVTPRVWAMPALQAIQLDHNRFPTSTQKRLEIAHGSQIGPRSGGKVQW